MNMKVRGNVLKRNSMRFAAALLAALASFVAGSSAALAAAPRHHDQAPGFYRVKVGDLEVTALFDGLGAFDPHCLNGTKATMDGVGKGTPRGFRICWTLLIWASSSIPASN